MGPRREDASRREFSRRVEPRLQEAPGRDLGLLPLRARRGRHRGRSLAYRSRENPRARCVRGDAARADDEIALALPLRAALAERGLSPKHAQDLLVAFRMDAGKHRYKDWNDLLGYCAFSANPVGRFVLDLHGESRATWPANDALCTVLQIINHLQDCGADFRRLNRVYIPHDTLAAKNARAMRLAVRKASPELLGCIHELAAKTRELLGAAISGRVADLRLSLEVAAIERLARKLAGLLAERDPLSQPVHLSKSAFALFW